MEYDRYQHNSSLYISGIICLILAMGLFLFSMYILPFLIWNLNYDVPNFIFNMIDAFESGYKYSNGVARFLVGLLFFIPAFIIGFISWYISKRMDDSIYQQSELDVTTENESKKSSAALVQELKNSVGLGLKILFLIIVLVIGILLLQVLVQITV